MKNQKKIQVFLVDDDALFLKLLETDFTQHTDFKIDTFACGELCLKYLSYSPDLIILDYKLDGSDKNAMNGIDTLDRIKSFNKEIPVMMLSSQDKIEIAIECMQHNAHDYVVKTEMVFMNLSNKINKLFNFDAKEQELRWFE